MWTGEQLLVFGGRDSHYGESKPSPATTDGTLIQLYSCWGGTNQQFTFD